jgi:hypothetical protein
MRRQRLFILFTTVAALCLLAFAVHAQQPSIDTVTTVNAYLRAGPGSEWRRITIVPQGTTFRLDGRAPGDYWLRGITPNGEVGFIAIEGLAVTPDQIAVLPEVWVDTPFTLTAPPGGTVPVTNTTTDTTVVDPTVIPVNVLPPPVNVGSAVTGFSYGGHVADFSQFASDAMARAGMTWVKRQVRFTPGQNPADLAGLINDAHARGFRILLGIVGDPTQVLSPGYFEQYASFVGGVAALGADAIEVWNEMNIDREWPAGSISPSSYVGLLAQAYNAIKSSNRNTMVISGAPAPTGFFGGCTGNGCDDNLYIQGMAAAGAANYLDCVGVHYNEGIVPPSQTSGDPRGNSGHYTRYFYGMINTYSRAFGGARPLCFTELGYLSPEGFGGLPAGFEWAVDTSVAEQASWLDSAVSLARSSGRVRVLIIWNVDFANYGADPMGGYAIIRPGGGCPACDALGS